MEVIGTRGHVLWRGFSILLICLPKVDILIQRRGLIQMWRQIRHLGVPEFCCKWTRIITINVDKRLLIFELFRLVSGFNRILCWLIVQIKCLLLVDHKLNLIKSYVLSSVGHVGILVRRLIKFLVFNGLPKHTPIFGCLRCFESFSSLNRVLWNRLHVDGQPFVIQVIVWRGQMGRFMWVLRWLHVVELRRGSRYHSVI